MRYNASLPLSYFYPRPPGGGRPITEVQDGWGKLFLSTPSGWRATRLIVAELDSGDISIHALRVEGDKLYEIKTQIFNISIHALRVEGDF